MILQYQLSGRCLGTGHKVKDGGLAEIGDGSSIFIRVGQDEIGHSSKTSLIQETEGENLQRDCFIIEIFDKGPVKLIKRVKIAHIILPSVSNQFHVIILSLPM